jgi:UDP-MurNAc hydroxylase
MEVSALGHAGLRVVGSDTAGLINPWLSRSGAFLGSWYPLPANDHLATSSVLSPDWVVVTSDREDRLDLATLERIPPRTPLFVPTYPSKRLLELARTRTRLQVFEVGSWMRVPLDDAGSWLRLLPAQSPAHPAATVLVSVDGESLLDCNDARLTIAQARRARLALGGRVDLATVVVADPSWHPLCYEYPPDKLLAIARQKRSTRLQVVRRLLHVIQPHLTVPFGGPPCFVDPAVAQHNRWIATPGVLPSPLEAQAWFREHSPDLPATTLMPGDRCHPRGQLVLPDPRWSDFSFDRLKSYLRDYALRRAVEISRLYATHPEPDDSLGERFAAHIQRLSQLSPYFVERISMTVRFEVVGAGGGRWDVTFQPGRTSVDLHGRAPAVPYRLTIDSRWVDAVVSGSASWQDLLFSLRVSILREPDVPNDHLVWLLRHANRNALLSIEAYERSRDLVGGGGRAGASSTEHDEEVDEYHEVEGEPTVPSARPRKPQRGVQEVPPSMR